MDSQQKEIAMAALRADFGWKYLLEYLNQRSTKFGGLSSDDTKELHEKVERMAAERFHQLYGSL